MGEPTKPEGGGIKWMKLGWFLVGAFVVIYSTVNFGLKAFRFGDTEFEFYGKTASQQSVQAQQPEVKQQADEMREAAAAEAAGSPANSVIDLTGSWTNSGTGLVDEIQQYGDQLVIQETYGDLVMATGRGMIQSDQVVLDMVAYDGTRARMQLQVAEANRLVGEIVFDSYAGSSPVQLER